MLTILIGKSASGKDTFKQKLVESGRVPIISYTSRPIRDGEIDGREYNFVSKEKFLRLIENDMLLEYRSYNTLVNNIPDVWYYGTPKVDISTDNYVSIVDLDGADKLLSFYNTSDVEVIYLSCSDTERTRRAKLRGSFDIIEWERRLKDDNERFANSKIFALSKKHNISINFVNTEN